MRISISRIKCHVLPLLAWEERASTRNEGVAGSTVKTAGAGKTLQTVGWAVPTYGLLFSIIDIVILSFCANYLVDFQLALFVIVKNIAINATFTGQGLIVNLARCADGGTVNTLLLLENIRDLGNIKILWRTALLFLDAPLFGGYVCVHADCAKLIKVLSAAASQATWLAGYALLIPWLSQLIKLENGPLIHFGAFLSAILSIAYEGVCAIGANDAVERCCGVKAAVASLWTFIATSGGQIKVVSLFAVGGDRGHAQLQRIQNVRVDTSWALGFLRGVIKVAFRATHWAILAVDFIWGGVLNLELIVFADLVTKFRFGVVLITRFAFQASEGWVWQRIWYAAFSAVIQANPAA